MNYILWIIIACEIAFWIVILLGLVTRYVFNRNKLGLFLLALTPVIDLLLLVTTSIDLYRGATATLAHAIAAVYIGASIAFGKQMIQWADVRFRYYILKTGPKPVKRIGLDYAKHYFKSWLRHVLAYIIGAGLLASVMYIINDPDRTEAMQGVLGIWTLILAIDFIISMSYFIWQRK